MLVHLQPSYLDQVLLVHPRFSGYMRSFVEERSGKREAVSVLVKMTWVGIIATLSWKSQAILDHERDSGQKDSEGA